MYDNIKILKAKGGDMEAFYEIIQDKKESLYKVAFAYTKNEEDAVDIISETVYRAYKNLEKLQSPEYFNTWITRILINCAIDLTRKKKDTVLVDEYEAAMDKVIDISIEKDLVNNIDLYKAIDGLNGKFKAVVILKYFKGLTIPQIADILECPIGTAKTQLHRALKKLRLELREDFISE